MKDECAWRDLKRSMDSSSESTLDSSDDVVNKIDCIGKIGWIALFVDCNSDHVAHCVMDAFADSVGLRIAHCDWPWLNVVRSKKSLKLGPSKFTTAVMDNVDWSWVATEPHLVECVSCFLAGLCCNST